MKKYRLYWTATIQGYQDVDALDAEEAEEQFDSQQEWEGIQLNDCELDFTEKRKAPAHE